MRKYKLADRWAVNERGKWIDASGDEITEERVLRHVESIKIQIIKHFPKGYCKNSGEEFSALFNNGIEEVYRCLTNFNKHECLTKVNSSAKFKRMSDADRLKWKQENQVEALLQGEKEWVVTALRNFYRRYRHDFSDKRRGGTEISVPMGDWLNECYAKESDENGESYSFGPRHGADVIPMRDVHYERNDMIGLDKQALIDLNMLMEIWETEGEAAYMEHFNLMSQHRKDNLRELYLNMSSNDGQAQSEYLARIYEAHQSEAAQEHRDKEDGGGSDDGDLS